MTRVSSSINRVFQSARVDLVDRADDHLAGLHVNAPDPLTRIDHHAFGDSVDASAVEVNDSCRPERGKATSNLTTKLFQLQVYRHGSNRGVFLGSARQKLPAH